MPWVATSCDPERMVKQGVCRRLPPTRAGGPPPCERGVDVKVIRRGALSVAAIRAWTLAAAAAGACLADHGEMIVTDSSLGPSAAVPEARLR